MSDAEQTRQNILTVTADEIHQHGFKATSLSVILNRCEISKGALYHHFSSKMELGYAVFEEIYTPCFLDIWQTPLSAEDPVEGLCTFLTEMTEQMSCDEVVCGCPLNNLCEEMANVDEGFRLRILCMQEQLNQLFITALDRVSDDLRTDIAFCQVGYFIVASLNGATSLGKSSRDKLIFQKVIAELCLYIRALKK